MPKRPPDNPESSFRVSRRTFLKTVGVGAAATGLVARASVRPRPPSWGPMPFRSGSRSTARPTRSPSSLGSPCCGPSGTTSASPGAKEVCERGACGGCTVLFDGEPVCACLMLAVDAVGHEITTVEGLGTPEKLSPVQAAFVECDAFQCGFCTPGFVVASTALLKKHPNPSLEEIKAGLSGNLCRCGTYSRIFEAVQKAAKQRG